MESKSGGGLRYSEGKVRVDLIPPEWILGVGEVMTKGAEKYAERNWEDGMDWKFCYAAAMRHLLKFWNGADTDEETGLPHVAHAAWNCLALLTYMNTYPEGDSRPTTKEEPVSVESEWLQFAKDRGVHSTMCRLCTDRYKAGSREVIPTPVGYTLRPINGVTGGGYHEKAAPVHEEAEVTQNAGTAGGFSAGL